MRIVQIKPWRLKNSRLFIRYLLSFVLVLLLPMLILTVLLYHYFFLVLEDEVMKNNQNILGHIQKEMDNRIAEMNKLAFQIYNNPELSTYKLKGNPVDEYKGIQLLKNYIAGRNYITDVAIYYGQADKVYSSLRTYSVSDFVQTLHSADATAHWFYEQVDQLKTSYLKVPLTPAAADASALETSGSYAFFIPNGTGSRYDKKLVLFMIDRPTFAGLLSVEHGELEIFDNRNQKVYGESVSVRDNVFTAQLTSPETGWTYFIHMPSTSAMHQVVVVKEVFLYVLLCLSVVTGLIALFFSRVLYQPIKLLKQFADSQAGEQGSSGNELEAVRMSIERMSQKNMQLHHKLEGNRDAVKEFLLLNLIKGNYATIEAFNACAKDVLPTVQGRWFCASVMHTTGKGKLDPKELIRLLESGLPEGLEGFGLEGIDNRLIFVWASAFSDFRGLQEVLVNLRDRLNETHRIKLTVGVGNFCQEADRIGKSYIEAFSALDYRFIRGNNQILYFESVRDAAPALARYPVNELQNLELQLLNGQTEQMQAIVAEVIEQILQAEMPLFEARCFCFDLINTVLKTVHTIHREYTDLRVESFNVMDLTRYETIEELGEAIIAVCADVCAYIQERKQEHDNALIDQLVEYMKAHYHDSRFSVQAMADAFQMSLPNLRYYFKKKTGQNITDYINYYRLQRAKELLRDTNMTVCEITSKIGYYDTSSFIKKFKREVGTTPGLFRKMSSGTS